MKNFLADRAALLTFGGLVAVAAFGVASSVEASPRVALTGREAPALLLAAPVVIDTDNDDVDDDFETASLHPLDLLPGISTRPALSLHRIPVHFDIVPASAVPRRCASVRGPPFLS